MTTTLPGVVPDAAMKALGLHSQSDLDLVARLEASLDKTNVEAIADFGAELGRTTSTYTDAILAQVRSGDLDKAGDLLGDLAGCAGAANLTALGGDRSKVPVIGPLIDRMKQTRGRVVAKLATVEGQIGNIVEQIEQTKTILRGRIQRYGEMDAGAREEYRLYGAHIVAAERRLERLRAEYADLPEAQTPTDALAHKDHANAIELLEKRAADLRVAQHSTLQTVPMIGFQAANDAKLLDKFSSAVAVTVPLLKRQFVLAIGLTDQRRAVDFAEAIDQVTNDLLTSNASLLHSNTVRAARANQRQVIDVDTLQSVQDTLVKTQEEVRQIQTEGERKRREVQTTVVRLQADIQARLGRNAAPQKLGVQS
jgi:uncharacterized protein YaaN involved in tellurite resistance